MKTPQFCIYFSSFEKQRKALLIKVWMSCPAFHFCVLWQAREWHDFTIHFRVSTDQQEERQGFSSGCSMRVSPPLAQGAVPPLCANSWFWVSALIRSKFTSPASAFPFVHWEKANKVLIFLIRMPARKFTFSKTWRDLYSTLHLNSFKSFTVICGISSHLLNASW